MTIIPNRLPNAVLFDWDNTLVDTTHDTLRALNAVCSAFNCNTITLDEFHKKPSLTIRSFLASIVSPSDMGAAETIFFQHTTHFELKLMPQAHTLVTWLHRQNIPTAIVSNKGGDRLRKEIKHLDLSHVFYCAIGSGDTPEDKPSTRPLLHALDHKNLSASRDIWFVGDSVVDMKCAHFAGCLPVSVSQQADCYEHPKVKAGNCEGLLQLLTDFHKREERNQT
jgi:phosphoglycolate phosphatase